MAERVVLLNPNPLVSHLKKPAAEFTKNDILQFIEDKGIKLLNFKYVAEDGKLKTLNFVITSKDHVDALLSSCERVDGSSLFSFVSAGRSDLYHLLSGMMVAIRHGLLDAQALEKAARWNVNVNIFDPAHKAVLDRLEPLPQSCWESAERLEQRRSAFEEGGIFPTGTIDRFIRQLRAFDDKGLSERLYGNQEAIAKLVEKYLHWG